jgi:hypothetical protein
MLIISIAALETGTRRWRWLGVCSLGAMLTIGLSGFEMIPAILGYALCFPLLFRTGHWSARLSMTFQLVTSIAVGLAIGFGARLVQNSYMLGSMQAVIDDFILALTKRAGDAGTGTGELNWGIPYNNELLHRLISYYPLHMLACVVGTVLLLARVRGILQINSRPLKWLSLVIGCELLWFVFFRQHAYIHVHTSAHILTSVGFGVAIVLLGIWEHIWTSKPIRSVALVIGSGLLVMMAINVGVTPYGNIQIALNWDHEQAEAATLRAKLPSDTIVFATHETYPIVTFLLGKPFILQPETLISDTGSWEPHYLLAMAVDTNPLYQKAKARYRLLQRVSYGELFEIR